MTLSHVAFIKLVATSQPHATPHSAFFVSIQLDDLVAPLVCPAVLVVARVVDVAHAESVLADIISSVLRGEWLH